MIVVNHRIMVTVGMLTGTNRISCLYQSEMLALLKTNGDIQDYIALIVY